MTALESGAVERGEIPIVTPICEAELAAEPETDEDRYWILATPWEAVLGLDDEAWVEKGSRQAREAASADWMLRSSGEQLASLAGLPEDAL